MSKSQSNRRQTIIVNKPLQKRIVMSMSLFPVLGLASAMALVGLFSHGLALEALQADVEMTNVVPLFLSVSVFVVMSGVFLLHNALRTSHRIAGPGYRICKSLKRIRSGDIGFRVDLRDGDFFDDVRDEVNLLLDWLNEHPPSGVTTANRGEIEAKEESDADAASSVDSIPPAMAAARFGDALVEFEDEAGSDLSSASESGSDKTQES